MDEKERLAKLDELKKKIDELQKQREELDKLISELNKGAPSSTNIPYTSTYTSFFPPHRCKINTDSIDQNELLNIKIFVNKKCNQISTDFEHTMNLVNEILPYKNNVVFKELFIRKLIDQGRVQVSGCFESYKPFSFLLFQLDSADMINTYVSMLISKQGSESELKGMYAIYFGFLNLKEDLDGCWLWISSVLNTAPNKFSGYVLEVFLLICGDLLYEKIKSHFLGIVKYIKKYYLKEIQNPPVETRIENILQKYN